MFIAFSGDFILAVVRKIGSRFFRSVQALSKDLFLFILPKPLTDGALSVILYPMKDIKKAYMKNYINAVRTDTMEGLPSLPTYQKLVQEREEEKKRDREIMFETAFPCVVFGVIVGLIMGVLLLRVSS